MSIKTVETKAIISAQDRTGSTFADVARKLKAMESAAERAGSRVSNVHSSLASAERRRANMTAASAAMGAAAVAVAERGIHRVSELARKTAETYREYDDLVRYQRAILGIDANRQKPLIDQAIHMGATTRFNDLQVLEAQLGLAQRGVKTDLIEPIVHFAADFGQAMNVDLPTAAKTLESALFSTGQDMETAAAALKNGQRATDFMVKVAKIGGLNAEDVQQLFKFGGASAHAAGLSMETMGALGAMMSRGGIHGDEAGVAIRSFAGSLVSPKDKALMALNALGIDFNAFVRTPGALSVGALDLTMSRTLGKKLSKSQSDRLAALLTNPEIIASQESFVRESTPIISESFKGKKGLSAQDAHKIAGVLGKFWRAAIESVDTEGLLRAIIGANPSAAQANSIFTTQQGGRFQIIAQRGLKEFAEFYDQLKHVPVGFAHGIGEERNAGFAGASARLDGAIKNFETALGRANDVWMTPMENAAAGLIQKFVEGGDTTMRMATAVGAATAAVVAFETALKAGAIVNTMAGNPAAAAAMSGFMGGAAARGAAFLRLGLYGAAAWGLYSGWQAFHNAYDSPTSGPDDFGLGAKIGRGGMIGDKFQMRQARQLRRAGVGTVAPGLSMFGFGPYGGQEPKAQLSVNFDPVSIKGEFTVTAGSELLRIVDDVKRVAAETRAHQSGPGSTGSTDFGNQH